MAATDAGAQIAPACSYRECGLAIKARWNGLAVVRGEGQAHVATLPFLFPRSLSRAFVDGGDSTLAWATRATSRRRVAAFFTDVGLLAAAPAVVSALSGKQVGKPASIGAVAGAAMFMVSVPLQFSADNALSRAVWWHNLRFTSP